MGKRIEVARTIDGVDYDADGRPIAPWRAATTDTGWGSHVAQAAAITLGFQILIWVVFAAESVTGSLLISHGIRPRHIAALPSILFSPFLHVGLAHIGGNASIALVVTFLVALSGWRVFAKVTTIVVLLGGLLTWVFALGGNHVGASGLIYGWLAYLIARGLFNRKVTHIALGLALAVAYSSLLFGFIPKAGLSWEGHLFGAVAGVVAAWASRSSSRES